MASVMIRTPLEKFFAANDKADQKIILTSGVNYVKKYCDEKGMHFAYYLDERKKQALTSLGLNLHPIPFLSHSHPFCKTLENNLLINVLPSLLGSGRWTFCSIKEGKVEQIVKKGGGVENNISVINRCICAKDFSRYDFSPEEVDVKTNQLPGEHIFPENFLRSLKKKKIFFHDEVHHWNSSVMIQFLEKVQPKIFYCSVVFPPELLAGIKEPQCKTFYDFKVEGDKLFFFPDGNRSEFYEQPANLDWLMKAKRFLLKDCEYTVKMISSNYCHHLIQISRGFKITESKRFFSNFDTIDLKVIHKERFRYYDSIPIRKVHLEKVFTYLMCLKKPDVESAIAKLRQLMEDEQDPRVVTFFCKFAKDVIEKFKGKIHLYETGWIEQAKDCFINSLPNFWGRLLSRWHGLNIFDFLFKLDLLRIEVDLVDVDCNFSARDEFVGRASLNQLLHETDLQKFYLEEFGPQAAMDIGWYGNLSKLKKDCQTANLSKSKVKVPLQLLDFKVKGRFVASTGIIRFLHIQHDVIKKKRVIKSVAENDKNTLLIKLRSDDGIDSYPEPTFMKDPSFCSKECPYFQISWLKLHQKKFGIDEKYKKIDYNNHLNEDVEICEIEDLHNHSAFITDSEKESPSLGCELAHNSQKREKVSDLDVPSLDNCTDCVEGNLEFEAPNLNFEVESDKLAIQELEQSVSISYGRMESPMELINIEGDGNCFYRALCQGISGNQEGHIETRKKFLKHALDIGFNLSESMQKKIATPGSFTDTWIINLFANCMNIKLRIHEGLSGDYYLITPLLIIYEDEPKFEVDLLFKDEHFSLLRKIGSEGEVKGRSVVSLDEERREFESEFKMSDGFDDFEVLRDFVSQIQNKGKFKLTKLKKRDAFFFSENECVDYGHDNVKYMRNQLDSVNSLLPTNLRSNYNACLVQIFQKGGEIPMHRDDEKVYDNDDILSINLNGSAQFIIERSKSRERHVINLQDGLYLKMLPGFQKEFKHSVINCSESRINVTFRKHVKTMKGHPVLTLDTSKIRNGCLIRAISEADKRSVSQVMHALLKKDNTFWAEWLEAGLGGTVDDLVKAATDLKFSFELLIDGDCYTFDFCGPKFIFELKCDHFSVLDTRPSCVERTALIDAMENSSESLKFGRRSGTSEKKNDVSLEHVNMTTFEINCEYAALLKRSFLERTTGLLLSEAYGNAGKNLEAIKIDPEQRAFKEIKFVCGFAGSGKSFAIQCRLAKETRKDFLVICPRNELKNDWLSKLHCSDKKVRTFEVALTLSLKKVELIVVDELGLFPNGYLDLLCLSLLEQGNDMCEIICLFDPLQSRYHSDLDCGLLDFPHDCDRLIDGEDFKYLSESRRMSSSFFGAFMKDIKLHNEGKQGFKLNVYDSVILAINEEKKKSSEIDLILVASRDEKRALSCSVKTLTFGESQGLTVNHACIVLSEYSEKQDDMRWMVALTRSRVQVSFVVMYRGGFQSFIQNNSARLIGLFILQSPLTLNRMRLMVKGNLIPCIKSVGCSDEMDREDRLEGDPFLKPFIFLGQRINSEDVDIFEPEVVEPICQTHIELPPQNFDQSINFDRIRAKEHREFRINDMCSKQFCEDFEHSRANGRRMTPGPMRYEAIYPRHKADDDVTFWMAVKKRLRFSEEYVERSKLKEAFGVGQLLYNNFKEKLNLKFNWEQALLDECVNDFEVKKLSKSKATLQAHSLRSDSDWKFDNIFLFMKSQLCTKFEKQYVDAKAGQTLACFAHAVLVKFAPYCRYMEKQLRNQFPDNIYIHSGKNFNDLNAWVEKYMHGQTCIESDYEAFDASQDEYILAFEVLLMEDMGMPSWFINDYIDLKCTLGCKLGHFAIMRFTGEFSTFLFNTLANMAFTFARYDCDSSVPMAFAGDDMCMLKKCDESDKFENVFEKISLKAKVIISDRPMFCGWNLCKYGIFKEPALVYNRFMVAEERGNVTECLENYAIEVSYAYMLGEKLYEFLKEEDRINYHQSVVRYIIKHASKLKTKVKLLFSSKDVESH